MLLQSPLAKILGQGALFLLLAATATGCGGCGDATLQCDDDGYDCILCDGYGCRPLEPEHGGVGGSDHGGAGQGGAGQGGAGQGGAGGSEATCDAELTTCPCDDDDACGDGTRCIDGLCIAACEFSYQCGAGRVCVNGECAEGCDGRSPCEEPGTRCDRGVCVPDPTNPECSDAAPCEGGARCVDGVCSTACETHADCAPGEVCNAVTGACMDDPSPQPGCATTSCAAQGQECMDDGYCHYPCSDDLACERIDSRFVGCEDGVCKTREEVAPECSVDVPCPDGEDCISGECR
ncbi:hypothetical protein SOCEGT47_025480 [Sorangium cellulosum]|uniref:Dumpy n=1 Tax=Sorangium cellulosum TaxID=56 RepID=A0A4P2PYT3_SORCE|nr:hypothetical protein [Sorangium cellulosum]AUX22047.1 hypothetical protein SOCEGT47_025480 [Sorangium cellulosum]